MPCQRDHSREEKLHVRASEEQASSAGPAPGVCGVFPDELGVRGGDSVFSAEAVEVFRMLRVGRLWGKGV